jgi:hypothetical protein
MGYDASFQLARAPEARRVARKQDGINRTNQTESLPLTWLMIDGWN